jgi:nitrite reductase/ring-hydroxylating ferredoxin subunit
LADAPLYELSRSDLIRGHHVARVGSREILVVESADGLRVWDGVCPHLAGPLLEGDITRSGIVCPWHNYEFDSATGRCRTLPGRIWREVDGDDCEREPMRISLRPLRYEVDGTTIRIYDP